MSAPLPPSPANPYCAPGEEVTYAPDLFGQGSVPHVMEGVPTWMAALGLGFVILGSHLLVGLKKDDDPTRPPAPTRKANAPPSLRHLLRACGARLRDADLLRLRPLKNLVLRPGFPLLAQSGSLLLFLLVLGAGLFGPSHGQLATVVTWTWWWALLVFFVAGLGNAFCAVCPWEALASLVSSLSFSSRRKRLGYELPWPRPLRNLYPALALFLLLTWLELGLDVTHSGRATASLGAGMAFLAVFCALVFERRAFCRHACLVGRVSGIYSLFSPVELRPKSIDACASCPTKDCHRGNASSTGCPTHLFPGALRENTYCVSCSECIRACPHDNFALRLRPPAADLFAKKRFLLDESVFALFLLALTSFHGLTMTADWPWWNYRLRLLTGFGPNLVFSLLMLLSLVLPLLLFLLGARCSRRLGGNQVSTGRIFKVFACSILPVALFYHLAHNAMHFFMEAARILPVLGDPFALGWNLFGLAAHLPAPLLSLETVWWIQLVLIVAGHLYGVLVADRLARRLFPEPRLALRALAPLILVMILYSAFSLWLIATPMEMRSAM